MIKKIITTTLLTTAFASSAFASGAVHVEEQKWPFDVIAHEWDKEKLYKGFQVATQVCMSCHSFKYISPRNFGKAGFIEAEYKAMAEAVGIKVNDKLMSGLSDEDAIASYAKPLPDLSLMNKARAGGADYVYALLTGYDESHEATDGMYYNKAFPGHNISMPPPLSEGVVEYANGETPSVEQMAHDVAYFMQWTAEPERSDRQRTGVYVMLYLIIFAVLTGLLKKAVWRDVKKH